jgi:glycosyltransferase involved in cell wall biosynthesis
MQILMSALQPGGGIRTFFRYVYGNQAFDESTFTLVAPDIGLSEFLDAFLPSGRVKLIPAESGKLAFVKQLRSLAESGRFELVHSHGFSAGILTELSLTAVNCPHLMTAHDVFNKKQFNGFGGYFKRKAMGLIFSRIDRIHTVTEDARHNLMNYFPQIESKKVSGILHGVDTMFFRDGEPENLKIKLELKPDTPLIGFFGRFMGQKDFRLIVNAIKLIKDQKLLAVVPHVATFGWGGFIREDYAYLESLGLKEYFHQMPQTDNMPGALKGVDLVAMPSRWEACGLLAMESLAAGVPIVGSNCIGLREVLNGSPAIQVPVGDAAALADAFVEELSELDRRRALFQEYQLEAVERFAIDRPSQALAELYRKMNRRAS